MLKIAYHPSYIHILPAGHRFPMGKYELIPGQLLHEGLIHAENLFEPPVLDESLIELTHDTHYWQKLRDMNLSSQEIRRTGFPLTTELISRETRIASGTVQSSLFAREFGVSFNIAGGTHHAGTNWGEGFCLLNDQAIAANYLLNKGFAEKILIIDLDVHQGNGTAQIFKDNPQVFTFSMHAEKNFPFRKEKSDLDIGLEDGTDDKTYLNILEHHLDKLFKEFNPDFVFYLAGVDVLATDALGKLSLTREGCKQRDLMVIKTCFDLQIPLQISMGGGYSPRIQDIVNAHCNTYRIALDLYS
ncbi:MAG: histone deacetylase [Daejeonella sp.]